MLRDRHDEPYLANPAWLAARVTATVLEPPPPLDLRAWAAENVIFPKGTPMPGPYRPELFPFFDRILDVLSPDHPAREVVLAKAAQLGGTVLAMIFVGGLADLAPRPILYTHPTEPNARRWMRLKFRPFIKASPRLHAVLATEKTKDASGTSLYVERKDGRGTIQLAGAASASSLSEISVQAQVQDDLAKWEENTAGDPERQADSRSKAYEWAKLFKVGTPLVEDNCRITKALKRGTFYEWSVPCPHCGHRHVLTWEALRPSIEADNADLDHPFFTCPVCDGKIYEHHLPAMNAAARRFPDKGWVARNPDGKVMSFHLPSYLSPLARWAEIAQQWLSAKGDPAAEQTFYNDALGLAYSRAGEAPPAEKLQERADADGLPRGLIPRGYPLLVLAFDCQGDRVEGQLVAFGANRRRAVVDYLVIAGHITEQATRSELDGWVKHGWLNEAGNRVAPDIVAIDGNAYTDDVYEWAKKFPRSQVIMVRGTGADAAEIIAPVRRDTEGRGRRRKMRTYGNRFFHVGVSGLKATLYEFLKRLDPLSRGFVSFAKGLGPEYFQQLTAERRTLVTTRGGYQEYRWVKPPDRANEALDTAVYAEAAATLKGWTRWDEAAWDILIAERDTPPEPAGQQLDLENLLLSPDRPGRTGTTITEVDDAPAEDDSAAGVPDRVRTLLNKLV